jgi:hypothetical protein
MRDADFARARSWTSPSGRKVTPRRLPAWSTDIGTAQRDLWPDFDEKGICSLVDPKHAPSAQRHAGEWGDMLYLYVQTKDPKEAARLLSVTWLELREDKGDA